MPEPSLRVAFLSQLPPAQITTSRRSAASLLIKVPGSAQRPLQSGGLLDGAQLRSHRGETGALCASSLLTFSFLPLRTFRRVPVWQISCGGGVGANKATRAPAFTAGSSGRRLLLWLCVDGFAWNLPLLSSPSSPSSPSAAAAAPAAAAAAADSHAAHSALQARPLMEETRSHVQPLSRPASSSNTPAGRGHVRVEEISNNYGDIKGEIKASIHARCVWIKVGIQVKLCLKDRS